MQNNSDKTIFERPILFHESIIVECKCLLNLIDIIVIKITSLLLDIDDKLCD